MCPHHSEDYKLIVVKHNFSKNTEQLRKNTFKLAIQHKKKIELFTQL